MRILLASNATYVPPRGGSTRSNLVWLRALAQAGHDCRVVSAAEEDAPAPVVERDGVQFHCVREPAERPASLRRQIESWNPDWVLISSEDLGHILLRQAFNTAPSRVVYIAHTPQFFPFGPESWHKDDAATRLLHSVAGVVVIGHSMADYVKRHLGLDSAVIHPNIYESPTASSAAAPSQGNAVTMINPCAVKGISIFTALADRFPSIPFRALRGWGTTAADAEMLARRPNVTIAEPVAGIGEELARARVLLMPSLWFEGFGLIVMEAMLQGIPVVSSDSGGLLEAKQGTGHVIPVRPIKSYRREYDGRHMPMAEVPPQDLDPWVDSLELLLRSDEAWHRESRAAKTVATAFVNSLDTRAFERMLSGLEPMKGPETAVRRRLDALTTEQRAQLVRKLREASKPACVSS